MYKEIDSSEIIAYIVNKQKKNHIQISFEYLKEIKRRIEKTYSLYYVVLGTESLTDFVSLNPQYISLSKHYIEIRGLNTHEIQTIINLTLPEPETSKIINNSL